MEGTTFNLKARKLFIFEPLGSRFALAVFATGMRSVRDFELEAQKAVVAASAAESSAAQAREQLLSAQRLLQVRPVASEFIALRAHAL